MLIENSDGAQALVRRRFAAPASRLWRAFTEPGDMAVWIGTGAAKECVAENDL